MQATKHVCLCLLAETRQIHTQNKCTSVWYWMLIMCTSNRIPHCWNSEPYLSTRPRGSSSSANVVIRRAAGSRGTKNRLVTKSEQINSAESYPSHGAHRTLFHFLQVGCLAEWYYRSSNCKIRIYAPPGFAALVGNAEESTSTRRSLHIAFAKNLKKTNTEKSTSTCKKSGNSKL